MFNKAKIHFQLPVEQLIDQTLTRREGLLNDTGALVIRTGKFTGRSPADRFIVTDELTVNTVDWNTFNKPINEAVFFILKKAMISYLEQTGEIWIRHADACDSKDHRLMLRIINEHPWANHFAANMFLAPDKGVAPDWTIIHAPGFYADPETHGTRQSNFTIISFLHQTILIGGSGYTGEIKKSVFTVLNFILPIRHNVLSMHCSANEGKGGDTALFFGLSGTGKTTLSADPDRQLIGDDEHGWDENGIFNFEGGCYAKIINLCKRNEPDIYNAIRRGALVENATFMAGSRVIDYDSSAITENTRVSYPLNFIKNIRRPAVPGIPKNIFFLTCDAYGVLPPISRLDAQQAMYYYISGYTAKIAGTENDVKTPQATFSACFGAPFLPLNPTYYAKMLKERLTQYGINVWLVNTGWTGGPVGTGQRIAISYTRALISGALNGYLDNVKYHNHPIFHLDIPLSCPGVPPLMLDPVNNWTDKGAYLPAAITLAEKFAQNYIKYSVFVPNES
jgi:phosphoenolpyruvate carboxykinase (ATP)